MKFLWPDPGINGLLFFLLGGIIVAFEITSRVERSREESRPETKEDQREKPPQFHLPPSASSAGFFLAFNHSSLDPASQVSCLRFRHQAAVLSSNATAWIMSHGNFPAAAPSSWKSSIKFVQPQSLRNCKTIEA